MLLAVVQLSPRCQDPLLPPRTPTLAMAVAQLSPASSISWSTLNLYSVKSSWSMAWASSCLGWEMAPLGTPKPGQAQPGGCYDPLDFA